MDNSNALVEPPWEKLQVSPQPSAFAWLGEIKVPALLIIGDKDVSVGPDPETVNSLVVKVHESYMVTARRLIGGAQKLLKGSLRGEGRGDMAKPWEGFWQILADAEDEDVIPFGNTTIAVRKTLAFVVLTRNHFLEIRVVGKRPAVAKYPPTEQEAAASMRQFHAYAGRCEWSEEDSGWLVQELILMASDPRLEGRVIHSRLHLDTDRCRRRGTLPNGEVLTENWRRLSGPGTSPLAGGWENRAGDDWWIYLTTAGHYGVMRVASSRPKTPSKGEEFNDAELYALLMGFGADAGGRLETKRTFDHWTMVGYMAGGEERKHPTFRIDSVKENEIVLSIPHGSRPAKYGAELTDIAP